MNSSFLIKYFFFGFFILNFLGCASSDLDKQKAEYYLKIGSSHLRNQAYPAAMLNLLKAEKLDPENHIVQNNLGLSYFVRNKFLKAQKHLKKSIALKPSYTDARINLARVYMEANQNKKALAQLRIADADLTYRNPSRPKYYLGLIHFYERNHSKAANYFRESLKLDKKDCLVHIFYGRTLLKIQKVNKALSLFKKAENYCVKNNRPQALYYKALTYILLKRINKAQFYLAKLMEEVPESRYTRMLKNRLRNQK